MKLSKQIKISVSVILVFFSGIVIGYSIHKYQPSFYVEIRNYFLKVKATTEDSFSVNKIIQKDLISREFYTNDLLNNTNQETFINDSTFINYFNIVSEKTFHNFLNNNKTIKKDFLIDNILDKSQVKFEKENQIDVQDFKKYYLPSSYSVSSFEIYKVKYYKNFNFGVLHKPKKSNGKLIIYNQGHGGNSYHYKYFLDLKSKYLDDGYDILNLNMPIRGFNFLPNKYISFPVNPYKQLTPSISLDYPFKGTRDHQIFRYYYDKNFPQKNHYLYFCLEIII